MTITDDEIMAALKKTMQDPGYDPYQYEEDNFTGEDPYADEDAAMMTDQYGAQLAKADLTMDTEDTTLDGEFEISKTDAKKGLVFGWASVIRKDGEIVVDRQKDFIDDDWEMEAAAYNFVMSGGVGGDEHVRKGVSVLVESMAFTDEKCEALGLPDDFPRGWWTGFQITDKEVMKGMIEGRYNGFSVHGTGKRTEVAKAKASATNDMSYNDRREAVSNALKQWYPTGNVGGVYTYLYINDMGDDWVVYNIEGANPGTYKASWTMDADGNVTVESPIEVKSKITYVKKGDYDSQSIADVLSRAKAALKGR